MAANAFAALFDAAWCPRAACYGQTTPFLAIEQDVTEFVSQRESPPERMGVSMMQRVNDDAGAMIFSGHGYAEDFLVRQLQVSALDT